MLPPLEIAFNSRRKDLVKIGAVVKGSLAEAKSMKVGSILRKINGRSVDGIDAAAVKQIIEVDAWGGRPLRLSVSAMLEIV